MKFKIIYEINVLDEDNDQCSKDCLYYGSLFPYEKAYCTKYNNHLIPGSITHVRYMLCKTEAKKE